MTTRSDFDLHLDAYRPTWLVAKLTTADDDVPSFVQARRSGAGASQGVATTAAVADAPAGAVPSMPPVPTTALRGAAAPPVAPPGRRRRHPDGYRRTAAAAPVEPVSPVEPVGSIEPTAPVDPAEPIGPIEPTAPVDPAQPIGPIGSAPPASPAATSPDALVPGFPGTAPPAPPDGPVAGRSAAGAPGPASRTGTSTVPVLPPSAAGARRPTVTEGLALRTGAPASREAEATPRTEDEPPVSPDGARPAAPGSTTPDTPDPAAGWEAAWSLRHAQDRRHAPAARASRRAAVPDAVPPSAGRRQREAVVLPAAEEDASSPEEDPTAGAPAAGRAIPDGDSRTGVGDDGVPDDAHRSTGPSAPGVPDVPGPAVPNTSAVPAVPVDQNTSAAPGIPTAPAAPNAHAVPPSPAAPPVPTAPAPPVTPAAPVVPAPLAVSAVPVAPVAPEFRSGGGAPYEPHGPAVPAPPAPVPDRATARRGEPSALVHRAPRSAGGALVPPVHVLAASPVRTAAAHPVAGSAGEERPVYADRGGAPRHVRAEPSAPQERVPTRHKALYVVPQYVAPPRAEGEEPGPETRAVRLRDDAPRAVGGPVAEVPGRAASSWEAPQPAMAVGSELIARDLSFGAPGTALTRAVRRWFGGPSSALVHVHRAGTGGGGTDTASPSAPEMSWGGEQAGGTATAVGGPLAAGLDSTGRSPAGSWTASPPPPSGTAHGGSGGGTGGGPGPGPSGDAPVPLDRTQEWADLLAMLADHRRHNPAAHLDDPALLDALAGRLQERVLAHIRRALVVDRERSGLLAPLS
ncbi:hypothetical protein V5N34_36645 [Streptomyces baarnensis]|uniref:hypothetical protein n=1 Tax=Streptomyces TaxID=1883 RepID=UPI0029B9F0E1|nr:hypothetical protein [Streptomyces sp. ME02-6979.5a]MDX3342602.1 hypothetical protein [Streptomyces sp. ME02-6979.5a]